MCARAGGVIAPIIYLLRNISRHAPMVVFGLCPLIGAALTMFLPETAHKPLPDTIEDVERTGVRITAKSSQFIIFIVMCIFHCENVYYNEIRTT
uniref:Si:dkey-119m7.8 n=2 Tax=Sinocyclocheilus TaxID=75365 RepID=A0A672KB32_SINGR